MSDTVRQQNHTAWLIELGSSPASSPLYFTGWDWRPDIDHAASFATRGAAQTVARDLSCDVRVIERERCETGWITRRTARRDDAVAVEQGDIVMLNSGGPEMTIDYIKDGQAYCTWYIDATHKAGPMPGHGHPPHSVRVDLFPLAALTLIAKRIPQELGGHDDRLRGALAPAPFGLNARARNDDLTDRAEARGELAGVMHDYDLIAGTPAGMARIASIALTAIASQAVPWEHLDPEQRARRISDVQEMIDNPLAGPYPTPWHRMAHAVVHGFIGTPDPAELNDYGKPIDSDEREAMEPIGIRMAPRGDVDNRFFNGEIVECREVQGNHLMRFAERYTAPNGDAVNLCYLDPQDRAAWSDGSCWAPDSELHSIGQQRFVVLRNGASAYRIAEVIAGGDNVTEGTIYRVVTTIDNPADAATLCEGAELYYRQVQAKTNACGLAGQSEQLAAA